MEKNEWLGHNPTPEDEMHMENLIDSAQDALMKRAPKIEYPAAEADNFLTVTDKNGEDRILYELLIDEMPDLGLSTSNEDHEGVPLDTIGAIAIKMTPDKTDMEFVENLHANPMIRFLVDSSVEEKEVIGRGLEDQGLVERGAAKRFLLRSYLKEEGKYPNSYQEEIEQLHGIEPMTDDEVKELMRNAIAEERQKKLFQDNVEREK